MNLPIKRSGTVSRARVRVLRTWAIKSCTNYLITHSVATKVLASCLTTLLRWRINFLINKGAAISCLTLRWKRSHDRVTSSNTILKRVNGVWRFLSGYRRTISNSNTSSERHHETLNEKKGCVAHYIDLSRRANTFRPWGKNGVNFVLKTST